MKELIITMYETFDGLRFVDKSEAENHEKKFIGISSLDGIAVKQLYLWCHPKERSMATRALVVFSQCNLQTMQDVFSFSRMSMRRCRNWGMKTEDLVVRYFKEVHNLDW